MFSHRPVVFSAAFHGGASRLRACGARLLLFLVFNMPLAAQDPGLPPPPAPTQGPGGRTIFSVDGRVVAGHDGANLSGVRVTLTDFRGSIRGTYYTRTGGAFGFSNLTPGRYTLTFEHHDFTEHGQTVDIIFASLQGMVVSLSRNDRGTFSLPSTEAVVPAWALQIPGKAQKEFNKGVEALGRGDAKSGIVHLQEAVQLYPRFATAFDALGTAYASAGDFQAAETAYEKALEIHESLFTAHLGLGTLYVARRRYPDAEKHLVRARQLKSEDWRVHYELGDLYWRSGNWPRAEENLHKAIQLQGKTPRIYLLLINVLAAQEKLPDALAAMEDFLRLFPNDRFARQVAGKRHLLRAEVERRSKETKQP